jgi:hypothetical protein
MTFSGNGASKHYTEETRDLAYHAALNVLPCAHFQGDWREGYGICIGCRVDAALGALAAAGRLVPPGSEVREEWSVVYGPDDALGSTSEAQARLKAARTGGAAETRRVITTPWVTAGPAATTPSPMEDR